MAASVTRTIYANVIEVNDAAFVGGTGAYVLGGAAGGLLRFQDAFSVGAKITYTVMPQDRSNTKYERNRGGSLASVTSLGRAVVESSNAGAAVDWVSGDLPLYIFCDSGADLVSSMREGEFGSAIPADLPRGGKYIKDLGGNTWQETIFDGTDQISLHEIDIANNIARPTMTGQYQYLSWTDAGAAPGPALRRVRNSATPTANDAIAEDKWIGKDSGGNDTDYVYDVAIIRDPTNLSEDGEANRYTMVAGASVLQQAWGDGVNIGTTTSRGSGKLAVQSELWVADQLVIDTLGLQRLRQYTIATKPAAGTAGRIAGVSDGAGNKDMMIDDGAAWRYPEGTAV